MYFLGGAVLCRLGRIFVNCLFLLNHWLLAPLLLLLHPLAPALPAPPPCEHNENFPSRIPIMAGNANISLVH